MKFDQEKVEDGITDLANTVSLQIEAILKGHFFSHKNSNPHALDAQLALIEGNVKTMRAWASVLENQGCNCRNQSGLCSHCAEQALESRTHYAGCALDDDHTGPCRYTVADR